MLVMKLPAERTVGLKLVVKTYHAHPVFDNSNADEWNVRAHNLPK